MCAMEFPSWAIPLNTEEQGVQCNGPIAQCIAPLPDDFPTDAISSIPLKGKFIN
jgi:hypothetical protein